MNATSRVQVLMQSAEAGRFGRFCLQRGHKKSTLIARLIREHLDREGFESQEQAVVRRLVG